MKGILKRSGVIFLLGPVFVIAFLLNVAIWGTAIIRGPIYYIISGKDPISDIDCDSFPLDYACRFSDWYFEKKFKINDI